MPPAPDTVAQLVDRFERHRDAYRNGHYGETQVRVEFIDPLFVALGWDVHNAAGYAEAYKDVVHEDAIKVGGATKAPDYCFRIGGARKFFLEAKKPSVDIAGDVAPAYQLRRYAWSAKLPLSILTDFEEFAVYDTRVRPKQVDKAAVGRTLYITCDQYAERWGEIAGVFSKDAVLQGSFDKYVLGKRKRGTAEVDAEFLKEIEQWRDALARNIALRNSAVGPRELNDAVQRTIDRIIFLRMCEDRGVEAYGSLQALLNGTDVYARLMQLFRAADDRYNSGLFHFEEEKGRATAPDSLTPGLVIDDKVLKGIFAGLYYPQSPYEFAVLPADILGNVYEQFLGKVIHLTPGHRARVEEKPEVKKAGGVYYTPKYIVDYIVEHTVGKLIEVKTPRQISRLRVLDPACGSGSFLIGAYRKLLDYHRDWYLADQADNAKPHPKQIYQGAGGQWYLTTAEKKRILLNNIYGVDIDAQAVEVTKLNLLLAVLENENQTTLGAQLKIFHERALPDLGSNIKCGNSLIGNDFYQGKQLALFDEEAHYRINAFDWEDEFPEVFNRNNPGFDAVIGNPPYVIVAEMACSPDVANYLNSYKVAQYKMDLYHLFIEKGILSLRSGGLLGYIVPSPWLTMKFTERLRHFILRRSAIQELVLFDHLVFGTANVHTALLILRRGNPTKGHSVRVRRPPGRPDAQAINVASVACVSQDTWSDDANCRIETRLIGDTGLLVRKLLRVCVPLSSIARASLGCQAYNRTKHTPEQIRNRVFHASDKLGEEYLPELAGSDVGRYWISRTRGQWIKYGPWLHDYRTMDWFTGPRILIREIAGKAPRQIQACYVEDTYCNYKTILNVSPSETTKCSMKYLCGVLNSSLLSFVYPYVSNKMVARSFPRISVGDLRMMPIPVMDFSNSVSSDRHEKLIELVDTMLALHTKRPQASTDHAKKVIQRQIVATDRQIGRLVYELYGLTEDEIRIVEEAMA